MLLKHLSAGALIDLIDPGSSVSTQQIKQAVQQVKALGFTARVKVASSLKKKFQLLKAALEAKDSEAVWCIRGGYGCQKLMPFLLRMKPPARPKLLIGYSDVTVLQMFLTHQWGWPVLHFPVLVDIPGISSKAVKQFQQIMSASRGGHFRRDSSAFMSLPRQLCLQVNVSGDPPPSAPMSQRYKTSSVNNNILQFTKLKILNSMNIRSTSKNVVIRSYLTGGNMTIIQSSIGTPWAGYFKNKILFLEDKGEAAYRVDRALWQMQSAGVFKGIKALALGDFITETAMESRRIRETFKSFSENVNFPVITGVPCGHGRHKSPLPFMTPCTLHLYPKKKQAGLYVHSPFKN